MSKTLCSPKANTERLAEARSIFTNLSQEDIDWTSEKFTDHFEQLGSTLSYACRSGMMETEAADLVQRAQEHIAQLMDMSRWKAALISVLSQFLLEVTRASLVPFEMDMTLTLIYSIIPEIPKSKVFDQSLDIEEDEAQATYLLQSTSTSPESVLPELFILVFRLLFSTKQALHFTGAVESRLVLYKYLYNCTFYQGKLLREGDLACLLEQCIFLDFTSAESAGAHDLVNWSMIGLGRLYYNLGFGESTVSPRLLSFAKGIFGLIPTASTNFTQDRWWFLQSTHTERILCKDVIKKLEHLSRGRDMANNHDISSFITPTMDNIHALGQRLLPKTPVPECPLPCPPDVYQHWITEVQDYVFSMHLLIATKYINLVTTNSGDKLFGDWANIWNSIVLYQGHIYEMVQLHFAKSVMELISLRPWNHPNGSAKSNLFHDFIWDLSHNWCWITDMESAKLLAEAIQLHKDDPHFNGMVWYEQACVDRCMEVIRDAEIVEEPSVSQ
ncbi:hypothetical protein D9758_011391 [Tetrapyrgos nigripes]|uniref:Uncharacterized protein n=1 Tax=Tetrapyrgos nigripes TaxID=182062 RepID=A0A8H5CRV3_9AGAR|nr:hypothetical protein D9758_011391 [Tetrapyrgos nigripes]